MDDARDENVRAQWDYTKAVIERAFEAFRHDTEKPEVYAPLFDEAQRALAEVRQWLRETPEALRQTQNLLLFQGAADGLARAERIERMQQVTQDAAQRAPQQTTQAPGVRYGR